MSHCCVSKRRCVSCPAAHCDLQEQRIRAGHKIKKLSQHITEQRLRVADRITKRIGIKPNGKPKGAVAAALEGDSSGDSPNGTPGDGTPRIGTPTGSRGDLADMIRRNGEELATSVEQVVEKVRRRGSGDFGSPSLDSYQNIIDNLAVLL